MNGTTSGCCPPRPRSRRAGVLAAAAAGIAVLATGCGSGGSGNGAPASPAPATLDGGIHVPDFTTLGLDPHTLQFQAAGRACGLGDLWQVLWWWPTGLVQP